MLNAWISKNDILSILSKCKRNDNLLEKRQFIIEINRLKEYKKHKRTKKLHINYISDIKTSIYNYKLSVERKYMIGYFENYFNNLNEYQKEHFKMLFSSYEGYEWYKCELDKKSYANIIPANNLKDIIKVSNRTILRWRKKGIIRKRIERIYEYQNGEIKRSSTFYYYDLSEIEEKIKYLIKES